MVVGADPVSEDKITSVSKYVYEGSYLTQGDNGVLVARDLANYLQLKVNDTLVPYSWLVKLFP